MTRPLSLACLRDYPEEGWPSMELCADMLESHLGDSVVGRGIVPAFRRRWTRLPWFGGRKAARNADRLANRLWDYPRFLRRNLKGYDAFHVCDHSYAHLIHYVPPGRGGVFCHDLDTFKCLLEPESDPRPRWYRQMARHILNGMQKAAVVFHTTDAMRRQILAHNLIDSSRLFHAPLGVSSEFRTQADNVELPIAVPSSFVLHVGSCIPRKRIDVLLDVFAAVRQQKPGIKLIQVGGEWTEEQSAQAKRLGIANAMTQIRGLSRLQLAALYRSAAVVLQPSEAEGFGLPIIEALACGAAVVASDLPMLREMGGDAVQFCPVADVPAWSSIVRKFLDDPAAAPLPARRKEVAERYSWMSHANVVARAYLGLFQTGANADRASASRHDS